ncbi:MAG: aspartate-semialdehyde dehydrogenase, partial [Gammaproteobacteria bacterium]|nr:aspartate-semialdehyde dehydrogenase [Gammaproteobacteria bacterium]
MLNVGFVGWRGMVGSVLMSRMDECGDWAGISPQFYTTSNVGGRSPQHTFDAGVDPGPLLDAFAPEALAQCDVVISCQGSDYTNAVHPKLRAAGWKGYWIDASSALRMNSDSILTLDPINLDVVVSGMQRGIKDYCGSNCTVSLMLMGLGGLFKEDMVEWMTTMTYQAASGAGAKHMEELAAQMAALGATAEPVLNDADSNAIDVDTAVRERMQSADFPTEQFQVPLAGSLIPWIDKAMESGETKEEWKGFAEGNKILGRHQPVPIDGQCVRIGAMRCHAQAVTVKLREAYALEELEEVISNAHEWVDFVENTPDASIHRLTPAAVTGTLQIAVGRVRKLRMGPEYLT